MCGGGGFKREQCIHVWALVCIRACVCVPTCVTVYTCIHVCFVCMYMYVNNVFMLYVFMLSECVLLCVYTIACVCTR